MKKNIKRNAGAKGFDAFRSEKKVSPPKVERKRFTERLDTEKNDPSEKPKPQRERIFEKKDSDRAPRFDSMIDGKPRRAAFEKKDSDRPPRFDSTTDGKPRKSTFEKKDSDRPPRFDSTIDGKPRKSTFEKKDSDRAPRFDSTTDGKPRKSAFEKKDSDRPPRLDSTSDNVKSAPKRSFKPQAGSKRPAKSTFTTERPIFKPHIEKASLADDDDMRLNKFVALCGIASRRAAADLIKQGFVTVNGAVMTEIGYRVLQKDKIAYKGREIEPVQRKVYILMNKTQDAISTASDERGRKTVLDLVSRTVRERVFPIGRLDRNTTGLLLLTNDGDLAQKLSHPSYRIKKLYHVVLNKTVALKDMETIAEGIMLDDGKAEIDSVNYAEGGGKDEVMIEIHIGKNRIVRRIFEHLGYDVVKLDRVYYGGLTKKDLPRGGYRTLTQQEIVMLKHMHHG